MKCPKCGGTGWDIVHGFDCVSCDGKGEIEVTNEEWFCGLSTEEKAEVLNDLYWEFDYKARLYYNFEPTKKSFEKWLKEKHE